MANAWKVVNTNSLKIRSDASLSGSSVVGTLPKGTTVYESDRRTVNGVLWIKHSRGWSATQSGGIVYLKQVSSSNASAGNTTSPTPTYFDDEVDLSGGGSSSGGGPSSSGGSSSDPYYGNIWKCVTNYVNVRSGPGLNYPTNGLKLANGETVEELDRSTVNGILWIKHAKGWSAEKSGGSVYLKCELSIGNLDDVDPGDGSGSGGSSGSSNVSHAGVGGWSGIKHLSKSQFACHCGGAYCDGYNGGQDMNLNIVKVLDDIIESGNTIRISSGFRCTVHNRNQGGVANSKHLSGNAVDFTVNGWSVSQTLSYLSKFGFWTYSIKSGNRATGYVHMGTDGGHEGTGSYSGGSDSGGGSNPGGGSEDESGSGSGNSNLWKCVTGYVNVRSGAGLNYPMNGQKLSYGELVAEKDRATVNGILWIKHNKGWSATESGGDTYLVPNGSGVGGPSDGGGDGEGGGTDGGSSGEDSGGAGTTTGSYNVWKVINTDSLRIRTGPGLNYTAVNETLSRGEEITEIGRTEVNGVLWIQHQRGWSAVKSGNDTYLELVGKITTAPGSATTPEYKYDDNVGEGYQPGVDTLFNNVNSNISDSEFLKMRNIAGVFGLPYQFLPTADVRLDGQVETEKIGYEYAERIVERIPLLFLCPGRANFMTRYSKANRKSVIEKAIQTFFGVDGANLEDLLTKSGRYYTFESDRAKYYSYVNPMCRIASRFLNIHNITINGTRLDNMNWANFVDQGIRSIGDFSNYGAIPFYVDSETSVNEQFSNGTAKSIIDTNINSLSDLGRELNFLLGYTPAATGIDTTLSADMAQNAENVSDMIHKLMGKGSFLNNVADHLATVSAGGKLIFPEIWSESNFSRNYSCQFKFVSPDPSTLSVYLNVLVPLFHLIGLVAPQALPDNPNGYVNPFLVRAVYKGIFNVDMGIITSMSVTKGAECQWTPEGVPTSINVSVDIKDLYSAMSITATKSDDLSYSTVDNTALMDYIANLCGINIFEPEIGRQLDIWFTNNVQNRIYDFFPNIFTSLQDRISNLAVNIFR